MNRGQEMKKEAYLKMVDRASPESKKVSSLLRAFFVGGLICTLGQVLITLAENVFAMEEGPAAMFTSVVLVFLGATLTGLGVYDKIGKFAGAGSIVPITGFANSIVAPAMEFRREGLVTGVGAKLFVLAGPVLVYGTLASVLVGLLAFFFGGVL